MVFENAWNFHASLMFTYRTQHHLVEGGSWWEGRQRGEWDCQLKWHLRQSQRTILLLPKYFLKFKKDWLKSACWEVSRQAWSLHLRQSLASFSTFNSTVWLDALNILNASWGIHATGSAFFSDVFFSISGCFKMSGVLWWVGWFWMWCESGCEKSLYIAVPLCCY